MNKMMLTDKQKDFIKNANKTWNFKIGATRSGKTWLDFNYRIMERTLALKGLDGLYVIMGVTNSTIERNVLEPMRALYGDKLVGYIQSGKATVRLFGETFHVIGAEKVSAMNKLQGTSIKYGYGDEIVRWNKEVFEMLKSRLDKDYSCFDATGNPEQPSHFIKQFIDEQHDQGDMFYQSITLDDNPTLPPTFVERLKREYSGTVYYNRYVLGQWAMAEGQIYPMFGHDNIINRKEWHELDDNGDYTHELRKKIRFVNIGVDFGGNKSATAFNCTAFTSTFNEFITVKDYKFPKELDPQGLDKEFIKFIKQVEDEGYKINDIRCDSAEQVLMRGLQTALRKHNMSYKITNARKGIIVDRIRFYQRMMNAMRYYIVSDCKATISAFENAVWSDKSIDDERLDDGTSNIDNLDSQEYSTEPFHSRILAVERKIR